MVEGNYENILKKISKASGLSQEDLERRVEAKRAKLAGLISKEGAAQVIAAELGISFEKEKLKIDELLPGMRKVNVMGKVINIFPVRTFVRKGQEGKVANFILADETSNTKVVLWDTNHIDLIEKGELFEGKVVEISNASMRDNEIHLGSFSELKLSNQILENVKTEKIVRTKNISDFRVAESVKARAFIMQIFAPRFFNVCPECKKKANNQGDSFVCAEHGKIVPEKRAIINMILDDGTETIRGVLFNEHIQKLGLTSLENSEILTEQKEKLLGKEMFFSGNVRNNKFFNNLEFIVDEIKEIDIDEIIMKMEK